MSRPPDVLFICTANFVRSRFAEAVFNFQADLAGLPQRAASRGFDPQSVRGDMSPLVEEELVRRGIPLLYLSPLKLALTRQDLTQSRRIIALEETEHRRLMRVAFPDWANRIEYWSAGQEQLWGVVAVFPSIEAKVKNLVAALAREHANRLT